jgi:uncharacterized protein (TIGR00299 family) protein
MKKILYFNCSSGVAGDMIIASLVDAGVPVKILEKKLKSALKVGNWTFKVSTASRCHYPAKLLIVEGNHHFKSPYDIVRILKNSRLSDKLKAKTIAIIETLIKAESKVHGVPKGEVHFHELNSIDTLIDAAGSCLALEMLGIEEVFSSPLNLGRPAPATLEIVKEKKIPVFSDNPKFELSTPTGAAIITNIASRFGISPKMIIERTGISTGTQVIEGAQNVLQALIGKRDDGVILLETNIDDMDPRIYPYVCGLLFKAGVKDAWLTQIIMKKGRPGIKLSVICNDFTEGKVVDIIFTETTTLGVRRQEISRHVLPRKLGKNDKTAFLRGGKTKTNTEFEQAVIKARKTGRPLREILR